MNKQGEEKMNFLPQDYEAPKASNNYMKMQEGENRIRILSRPIVGWEDWQDRKPIRYKMNEKPTKSIDAKKPMKHFWSFIVWNVNEEKIQIMHVTQSTIRRAIEALCNDPDWGVPFEYDIKINRTGDGIETEYTINPVPHKKIEQEIIDEFNKNRCNLNALFTGEDPFLSDWEYYTPFGLSNEKVSESVQKENGKIASQEMMDQFFKDAYKKYPVQDIDAYIKEWCEHFKLKKEHAIWSFMSDLEGFDKSMKDRKKK